LHESCKFKLACTNAKCSLKHPDGYTIEKAKANAFAKTNGKKSMQETILHESCKFKLACTNAKCSLKHPDGYTIEKAKANAFAKTNGKKSKLAACKFGAQCTKGDKCTFSHSARKPQVEKLQTAIISMSIESVRNVLASKIYFGKSSSAHLMELLSMIMKLGNPNYSVRHLKIDNLVDEINDAFDMLMVADSSSKALSRISSMLETFQYSAVEKPNTDRRKAKQSCGFGSKCNKDGCGRLHPNDPGYIKVAFVHKNKTKPSAPAVAPAAVPAVATAAASVDPDRDTK
jgi:hypothetical protein